MGGSYLGIVIYKKPTCGQPLGIHQKVYQMYNLKTGSTQGGGNYESTWFL